MYPLCDFVLICGIGPLGAIASNDPNVLLVGTNTGICRSTDSGRSWAVVWAADAPGPRKVYSLANTATDPDLVFPGHTEEGVLRSDDGGSDA